MTLYEQVQELLSRESNPEDPITGIPDGWANLWFEYVDAVGKLQGEVKFWRIERGILRTKSDGRVGGAFHWIDDGVAKSSSRICIVSGYPGIRRKKARGWPCLSTQLWIEYANEMPEQDWLL
jgi:hypothetical protein